MPKVIGFVSLKGGTGKTTIALAVARTLRDKLGIRVGVLDADFDSASFAQMTNTNARIDVNDTKNFKLFYWNGIPVFSMSLLTGREASVSQTGDRYARLLEDIFLCSDWNVDIIIVDLPAGSSDVFRSVMKIFGANVAGNIVIMQPSMTDALHKVLDIHEYFGIPVLGIIENMTHILCEHKEGAVHHLFPGNMTEQISQKYGVSVIGELPYDENISDSLKSGNNFEEYPTIFGTCEIIRQSEVTKTKLYKKLTAKIMEGIEPLLAKVLGRIINQANIDFNMSQVRQRTGFVEQRVFRLMITDESMETVLAEAFLRLKDSGLKIVPNPKHIDFQLATDYRTLARMVMRKRKVDGRFIHFDTERAWRSGDIKVYGRGVSPRALAAIRVIFGNEQLMSKVGTKYDKLLKRFL